MLSSYAIKQVAPVVAEEDAKLVVITVYTFISREMYLIFYRVIEEGVEILRVVSGYRDLENLFSEQGED